MCVCVSVPTYIYELILHSVYCHELMNTNGYSGILIDGGNVQIVHFYVLRLVKTMPNESEKKTELKKKRKNSRENFVSLLTLIKTIS